MRVGLSVALPRSFVPGICSEPMGLGAPKRAAVFVFGPWVKETWGDLRWRTGKHRQGVSKSSANQLKGMNPRSRGDSRSVPLKIEPFPQKIETRSRFSLAPN